jgi:hypothetical protein
VKEAPVHWLEGEVGPGTGLNVLEKRKAPPLEITETRLLVCPACNLVKILTDIRVLLVAEFRHMIWGLDKYVNTYAFEVREACPRASEFCSKQA